MRSKPTWSGRLIALITLAIIFSFSQAGGSQAESVLSVTGIATGTYPGQETTYQLELLNHSDQIVYDGLLSITLPDDFTYVPGSTVAMGEGWPFESHEPQINGQTLTWGPYHLPTAGNKAHNPYGIHTLMHDCAEIALHLETAKKLIGNGGYVTQLFYGLDLQTGGPSQCAINFVVEAYARNLIPILRLQGHFTNGVWQAPDPGPDGDYSEIAGAYAKFVSGLPRRSTNPLYIQVWNEPDLWIEWSGSPNAGQYARFFVAVSRAVRQLGDARIRLLNGALTPGNTTFLKQMLPAPGFRDAFDVWSSHCYPYNHPASYNNHNGTAHYGTYAIDCYRKELSTIRGYGRSGVKVILTETGYELGDNTFGFEGFPKINEINRANYIASAFADYWQSWPEIIAVTPFQLSDTSDQWYRFDWVYPTPPYPTHRQFMAVAALPKPSAGLEPYGYQITFKATVDSQVEPGLYYSQLRGSARDGQTALAAQAAPVRVYEPGALHWTYLPLIKVPLPQGGPWYLSETQVPSPGAITPSAFLKPAQQNITPRAAPVEVTRLNLAGEPQAIALAESVDLGAVILADGRLEIIDLAKRHTRGIIFVGDNPQAIVADTPDPGQAYVSLADGLALVELRAGRVVDRLTGLGRLRGLAWDAAEQRLFVVQAEPNRLLILSPDLARQLAAVSLDEQPDQLIFDAAARQLYLSFPAISEVIAIEADSLVTTARAGLSGGPILDLAFDPARNRLYALSALAPTYRGLAVWQTPGLEQLALVAGAGDFPLRTASAIALTPDGQIVTPETTGLWQIAPTDFAVSNIYPGSNLTTVDELTVGPKSGTIYMLEALSPQLRIY